MLYRSLKIFSLPNFFSPFCLWAKSVIKNELNRLVFCKNQGFRYVKSLYELVINIIVCWNKRAFILMYSTILAVCNCAGFFMVPWAVSTIKSYVPNIRGVTAQWNAFPNSLPNNNSFEYCWCMVLIWKMFVMKWISTTRETLLLLYCKYTVRCYFYLNFFIFYKSL